MGLGLGLGLGFGVGLGLGVSLSLSLIPILSLSLSVKVRQGGLSLEPCLRTSPYLTASSCQYAHTLNPRVPTSPPPTLSPAVRATSNSFSLQSTRATPALSRCTPPVSPPAPSTLVLTYYLLLTYYLVLTYSLALTDCLVLTHYLVLSRCIPSAQPTVSPVSTPRSHRTGCQ